MRRVSDWFFESFQGLLGDEDGYPLAMVANTKGFSGAHFATFPPAMVEPCILAGCPEGGTVLDPFAGSGTTGVVALKHFRKFVGIELNPDYANEFALPRIEAEASRHKQMAII
jgi:DNA modification methylase